MTAAHGPSLQSFDWTIKVNIASDKAEKLLEPVIECDLALEKANSSSFEISLDKFHLLRYSVAQLASKVEQLKANKAMQD